jgi:hypothetical protein
MKQTGQWILTTFLILFLILTFYSIFNTGNPKSFFRIIIPNSSYDVAITLVLGVMVAALAMVLYAARVQSQNPLKHLLEINEGYIQELRQEGKSEDYIAESFLKELGSKKGMIHSLAKRRVLKYLTRI